MHASGAAHVSCVPAVDAKNAVKDAASKAAAGAQRMAGLDPKQGAPMLTHCHSHTILLMHRPMYRIALHCIPSHRIALYCNASNACMQRARVFVTHHPV